MAKWILTLVFESRIIMDRKPILLISLVALLGLLPAASADGCLWTCACDSTVATFNFRGTGLINLGGRLRSGNNGTAKEIHPKICSVCRPFCMGREEYIDTAGQIERLQGKYGTDCLKKPKKFENLGILAIDIYI